MSSGGNSSDRASIGVGLLFAPRVGAQKAVDGEEPEHREDGNEQQGEKPRRWSNPAGDEGHRLRRPSPS